MPSETKIFIPARFLCQTVTVEWGLVPDELYSMEGTITQATEIYIILEPKSEHQKTHLIPWNAIHDIMLLKETETAKS